MTKAKTANINNICIKNPALKTKNPNIQPNKNAIANKFNINLITQFFMWTTQRICH